MNCPNCKNPFAFKSDGKHRCDSCGWFEYVDDEWQTCEAPEPATPPAPAPPAPEPKPEPQVKDFLGGIVTVTEVDE